MLTGREQRILVLGNSGSGKSTLTRQLSEVLGLPAVHLDRHFWNAGWVETPKGEWLARVPGLCAGPRWIQDGNFASSLPERLKRADTVLLFDRPTPLCLWRILRRWAQYRGETRPDLAPACEEKLDWRFLGWVCTFRSTELPRVRLALENARKNARKNAHEGLAVHTLRTEQDVLNVLASARSLVNAGC